MLSRHSKVASYGKQLYLIMGIDTKIVNPFYGSPCMHQDTQYSLCVSSQENACMGTVACYLCYWLSSHILNYGAYSNNAFI